MSSSSLKEALESKESDLSSLLNFYPVKPGDFFYVPAGTIHAIGAGLVLAEIQQSSGITYRLWDWNRVDENNQGRELHIDKALEVSNFKGECNTDKYFLKQEDVFMQKETGKQQLVQHPQFRVQAESFNSGIHHLNLEKRSEQNILSLVIVKGTGQLRSLDDSVASQTYQAYESYIIAPGTEKLSLQVEDKTELLWID